MCGICGFLGTHTTSNIDKLTAVNSELYHRGPDDSGVWLAQDKKVALAHRRLSIVDLSQDGHQPMVSSSGRYVIAFNGEVYNFKQLRQELIDRGHTFTSKTDTEVLLSAFEQWGVNDAVQRFNGMFAAALWDHKEQNLYLFRDRAGVKPLYYLWSNNLFFFSSELVPSFAQLTERIVDRDALTLYFRNNYIPAPKTIYKGIFKLIPGVIAKLSLRNKPTNRFDSQTTYWSPLQQTNAILKCRNNDISMADSIGLLEKSLSNSIRQRMIADVPLGAFLSGGIDSSLVVAHMQKLSDTPVKTFTIGFLDQDFSEAGHAKTIAEHLGTDHTEFTVTEKDAIETIPYLPNMYGEPFADSSQIPTYLVSKLTRQNVTVALSGDGGDELFAGYDYYLRLKRQLQSLEKIPPSLFVAIAYIFRIPGMQWALQGKFGYELYETIFRSLRLFARDREKQIPKDIHSEQSLPEQLVLGNAPGASVVPFIRCHGNLIEQVMLTDFTTYLPDDILTKVDRASMHVSLEVRAPFVDDFSLFETAWKISLQNKLSNHGGKLVLKKALSKYLPKEFFMRPKMGFSVPLVHWLNGPLNEWVQECVAAEKIQKDGYLNSKSVDLLLKKTAAGDSWYAYKLWAVCIFQSWLNNTHKTF